MALRSFRLLRPLTILASVGVAAWIAACGSTDGSTFDDGNANKGDADFSSSGFPNTGDGSIVGSSSGEAGPTDTLRIDPPTIDVYAKGTLTSLSGTQTFKAYVNGATAPTEAIWSVDDVGIGTIDNTGVFKTSTYAGVTKVRAKVGALVATADVHVHFTIEEVASGDGSAPPATGPTQDQKDKLKAGGGADGAYDWLYPYDNTVFPRGLLPPKLMFSGANPDWYYIHLTTKDVEYTGYYKATGTLPRVVVSNDWWSVITRSAGKDDPVTIEVTKLEGTKVTGPKKRTWSIAQGSLKGTVFYNTYNSQLVKAAGASGAVMRLKPGANVEVFIGKTKLKDGSDGTCTVCHSVSANGTALVAGLNWGDKPGANPNAPDFNGGNPVDSAIFSISTTGAASSRYITTEGKAMPFGALSPDGNWLVGNASSDVAWLRGLSGKFASRVYDAKTGAVVEYKDESAYFSGKSAHNAVSPTFSPDGKHLAFADRDDDSAGHRLSIMDANLAANPPTFEHKAQLASNLEKVLGWPTFLPDSKAVIFQEGTTYDTGGWTDQAQLRHYCGDLFWIDTALKLKGPLSALNGYKANNQTSYLPFANVPDPDPNIKDDPVGTRDKNTCNTEDLHMNYEPTVLPVAVGGYYWVVFTSRRAYGNYIWRNEGSLTDKGDVPFDNTQEAGNGAIKGYRKKLWVAAINIDGKAGTDISHPAFLLEGQEMEAGNMRGFWALDPCKADGAGCEGGDECCNGFCRATSDGAGGTKNACVAPPTGCANESEKCTVTADCCAATQGTTCIGGFCTAPTPGVVH